MKPRHEIRYLERSQWGGTERAAWVKTRLAAKDADTATIQGYSSTFNQWYPIRDFFGEFQERFDPKSFDKSLRESGNAVVGLFNHNLDYVLGSVGAGTMRQGTDGKGLWFEIDASVRSPQALSVIDAVERGDVNGSSIAFQVIRDIWEDERDEDGNLVSEFRTIMEARLYEHGPVTMPANPYTSADVEEKSNVTDAEVKSVAIKVRRGLQLTAHDVAIYNSSANTDLFRQNLVNVSAPLVDEHPVKAEPLATEHPDASTLDDKRRYEHAHTLRRFKKMKARLQR